MPYTKAFVNVFSNYKNNIELHYWEPYKDENSFNVVLIIDHQYEIHVNICYTGNYTEEENEKFSIELENYLMSKNIILEKKEDNIYVKILKHNKNKGC